MKIVSWNVNGIRAAFKKKELQKCVEKLYPDILLIQETKSTEKQVEEIINHYSQYQQWYQSAEKAGYSGTSIWAKKEILVKGIQKGSPLVPDTEGRILRLDIQDWSIYNIYFPNGGKSEEAWRGKLVFYEQFLDEINTARKKGRKVIWAGDINCAHNEIDLARPKDNDGKIGFHPDERKWLDKVEEHHWVDIFRKKYPKEIVYSYWHMLSGARARNVGWRIDYFFADEHDFKKVKDIRYDTTQQGSDHCPVILEIDMK